MAHRTETGFQTKQLLVEHLTDGCVRVLNTRNGQYVQVSQSEKGTKSFVHCGHMETDELKRYLMSNAALTGAEGVRVEGTVMQQTED